MCVCVVRIAMICTFKLQQICHMIRICFVVHLQEICHRINNNICKITMQTIFCVCQLQYICHISSYNGVIYVFQCNNYYVQKRLENKIIYRSNNVLLNRPCHTSQTCLGFFSVHLVKSPRLDRVSEIYLTIAPSIQVGHYCFKLIFPF